MSTQTVSKTLGSIDEALAEFRRAYPGFDHERLEELRAKEYGRLDKLGHVYLDYLGGSVYAESQLDAHVKMLKGDVFGNPHSNNPTSLAMTELTKQARAYVFEYFNASPDEYVLIFTPNASGALKLVGESYPFKPAGRYLMVFDNHNSVIGIREYARARGAAVAYAPVLPPELRIDAHRLTELLDQADPAHNNLFAYPAQSNFSGVQHPLEWIEKAQRRGWDVILDAAAFASTNRLDLSCWHPDFVALSFYKIFGYPTGVGCLLARRPALEKLCRPWFAGGTVTVVSVQGDGHYLEKDEVGFEDGTINYLSLPAIEIGLRHIAGVGIDLIHERVICLTAWLIDKLLSLRHGNGAPLVHLYGPADTHMRGGTVALNFFDPRGKPFAYRDVEAQANHANISLRSGFFCNPGAVENAHGLSKDDVADCFGKEENVTFNEYVAVLTGRVDGIVGALRISMGLATNFKDLYRFIQFVETYLDRAASTPT